MRWILLFIALSPVAFGDGNLLKDPDFDDAGSVEDVAHWQSFVEAGREAHSSLSPKALSGSNSAHLSTGEAYAKEPYNNWSQVIREVPDVERLWLSGSVRTDGPATASLWIQCFQNKPIRVLKAESVSAQSRDEWTHLHTSIELPRSVDFIMVRCVIEGEGQAWFDSLVLSEKADDHGVGLELELLEDVEELTPDLAGRVPDPDAAQDIIETAESMKALVNKLALENQEVLARLDSIQKDLNAYKKDALAKKLEEETLESLTPTYSKHPLVPYGYFKKDEGS